MTNILLMEFSEISQILIMDTKILIKILTMTQMTKNMQQNLGAIKVKLSTADMAELETGFASIGVFGDRAPENLKAAEGPTKRIKLTANQ